MATEIMRTFDGEEQSHGRKVEKVLHGSAGMERNVEETRERGA